MCSFTKQESIPGGCVPTAFLVLAGTGGICPTLLDADSPPLDADPLPLDADPPPLDADPSSLAPPWSWDL